MDTLNIKGKLGEDIKRNGELWIRTDNNVPYGTGKIIRISEDVVHLYQKLYDEDNDYFKTTNISYVVVMKVEDYVARTWRGYEDKGKDYKLLPLDMLIEYEETMRAMRDAVNQVDEEERQEKSGLILPN